MTNSEQSVTQAMAGQSDAKSGAFHLFLYLTGFLSFAFVFFGLVSITFDFFNKNLAGEDPLMGGFDQSSVRTAIAFLIIATPIYYFILRLINKKLLLKEIELTSGVRKVLTYLFLFVLSAIIIGDLIFLLSSFLNGDYTELFLAKALAMLFFSVFFGLFYFWEVRRSEIDKKNFSFWQNGILGVVILVLVLGFFIIDRPTVAREKRLDGQIISGMSSLRREVETFYSERGKIPALEELKNQALGEEKNLLESGQIKYLPQASGAYSFCGVFKQAWDGKEVISGSRNDSFWEHPQGKYCFEIKENLDGGAWPSNPKQETQMVN